MSIIHYVLGKEHWLGLNNIFDLTQKKDYRLRIKMRDFNRVDKTVYYDNFYLEDKACYKPCVLLLVIGPNLFSPSCRFTIP